MFLVVASLVFSSLAFAGPPTPLEQCLFAIDDTKGMFGTSIIEDQLEGGRTVEYRGQKYEMRNGYIRRKTPNERLRKDADASRLSGLIWNVERAKTGNGKLDSQFPTVDLVAIQQKFANEAAITLRDKPNITRSPNAIRSACRGIAAAPQTTTATPVAAKTTSPKSAVTPRPSPTLQASPTPPHAATEKEKAEARAAAEAAQLAADDARKAMAVPKSRSQQTQQRGAR